MDRHAPVAKRTGVEVGGADRLLRQHAGAARWTSRGPTVRELLGRVKARRWRRQQHQDIPFEQVVELRAARASLAHTPLFQVMFAWQNAPAGRPGARGARRARGPSASGGSLRVRVRPHAALQEAGGRIAGVEYATALFERATVERYGGYLARAAERWWRTSPEPVGRLALLRGGAARRCWRSGTRRRRSIPAAACIHELFEAGVRAPDAVAVVFEGRAADLRGAERAGQPAGAPPAALGRGARRAGGGSAWSAAWRWWWRCWRC